MTALLDRALDLPSMVFAVLVMAVSWAIILAVLVTFLLIGELVVAA